MLFGVATDVCNDAAIRGLLARGRSVTFVEEASRGLDEARTAACIAAWRESGVRFASVDEVDRRALGSAASLPMGDWMVARLRLWTASCRTSR